MAFRWICCSINFGVRKGCAGYLAKCGRQQSRRSVSVNGSLAGTDVNSGRSGEGATRFYGTCKAADVERENSGDYLVEKLDAKGKVGCSADVARNGKEASPCAAGDFCRGVGKACMIRLASSLYNPNGCR